MHRAGNGHRERERWRWRWRRTRREDRRQPLKSRDMYKRWPRHRDERLYRPNRDEQASGEGRKGKQRIERGPRDKNREKNSLKNNEKDE